MAILLILLSAFILRLIILSQSLWLDEAVQAITARASFSYIFQEITGDFHPPLYHFLMHFWVRIFGSTEYALRMPSVLFGVGTVYFVYLIAKQIGNNFKFAELSALLLATAPFHIYYSQEARMYSMVTFLTAASMFFFLKINGSADAKIKKLDFLVYFLFTLLALYTDYYAFLILLTQSIFLLTKKQYKFLLLNTFFLILFYLPWLPMLFTQIKTGMLATQVLPEWGRLVNLSFLKAIPLTFIKFTIGRITIFNKIIYALVSGILLLGIGSIITRGCLKGKKLLIILWFFVPLGVSWLASLFVPNYQPFRLLLILPAFYLLLAVGIGSIVSKKLKWLAVLFILGVNLASLSVYYTNPFFQREDWRGLTSFLKKEEGTVILPSDTSDWPIKYYDPKNEIKLVYGGTEINKAEKKVLFIRYLVPLFDPKENILAELSVLGYTKVKEISFNQIPIWEFEKK